MRSRTHRGSSRLRAARTVVLFLALVASTLTGCSAEHPHADDPSGSAGPSGSVGPIDESTGTPSGESSSPAEPDGPLVATGPVIEQNALHLTLTEGNWIMDRIGSAISASDTAADGPFRVALADLASTNTDLEVQANAARLSRERGNPGLERVANRTINGVECWAMVGKNKDWYKYSVGGLHNGYQFSIDFSISAGNPDAEELIEAMLASIEWQ